VLAFLIPYAGEWDPARKILRARVNDPGLDPAQVEALTRELGLDPAVVRAVPGLAAHHGLRRLRLLLTSRTSVHDLVVPALSVSMSLALAARTLLAMVMR
jgi:peptide/nickel transport system permease protein